MRYVILSTVEELRGKINATLDYIYGKHWYCKWNSWRASLYEDARLLLERTRMGQMAKDFCWESLTWNLMHCMYRIADFDEKGSKQVIGSKSDLMVFIKRIEEG